MNYFAALQAAGKPIAYYAKLAKPLGGVTSAVLFSQLLYWHDKTDCELGTYKTVADIEDETGLTEREQETACKKLCALGVLIKTYKRLQHRMYYRLDEAAFNRVMAEFEAKKGAVGESAKGNSAKGQNAVSRTRKNAVREDTKCGLDETAKTRVVKGTLDYQEITNIDYLQESNAHECATPAPEQIADKQPEKPKTAKAKKTDLWAEGLAMLIAEGVDEAVAKDHIAFRKLKSRPLTQTALNLFRREAEKAGISIAEAVRFTTENTWTGFKAEWWERHQQGFNGTPNGFVPTVRKVEQVTQGGLRDMRTGELLPPPDVNIDDVNF